MSYTLHATGPRGSRATGTFCHLVHPATSPEGIGKDPGTLCFSIYMRQILACDT